MTPEDLARLSTLLDEALELSRCLHDVRAANDADTARHALAQALRCCGDEAAASTLDAEAQRLAGVQ